MSFRKLIPPFGKSLKMAILLDSKVRSWGYANLSMTWITVNSFGGCYNRCFWDARMKILRLINFNMLFQLVLTKFFKTELFSCLPKVDHVIKSCKESIPVVWGEWRMRIWSD